VRKLIRYIKSSVYIFNLISEGLESVHQDSNISTAVLTLTSPLRLKWLPGTKQLPFVW